MYMAYYVVRHRQVDKSGSRDISFLVASHLQCVGLDSTVDLYMIFQVVSRSLMRCSSIVGAILLKIKCSYILCVCHGRDMLIAFGYCRVLPWFQYGNAISVHSKQDSSTLL